jgi:transposase-like protein
VAQREVVMPVAGVDYPSTWPQFRSWFPDDASCVAYLERLRWPDGFVCPMCGSERGWRIAQRDMWMCVSCGRKTSVTAGTIFHRSRLPISSWFAAAWFICAQKNGVSALGLQRVLGLGSYETAWSWLHKFRRAMVRPDRDKLDGLVEVDETYFGARDQGKDGRGTGKSPIVIAVEMRSNPKRLGRVRLAHIPALSAQSLCAFVNDSVAKGVTVRTDGWNVYQRLGAQGYRHTPINVAASGDPAHIAMPGVHRVAALLKRWLTGTLHYSVSDKHLDYYLDEFAFRFNRRNANARGLLFHRLLQQAVNTDPHPYHELTADSLDQWLWD